MVTTKELNEAVEKHLDMFVKALKNIHHPEENIGVVAQVADVTTAVALYRSSKNLERLSFALIGLTAVLALLTAVLVWRTWL